MVINAIYYVESRPNGISLVPTSHEDDFNNLPFNPIIINDIAAEFTALKAADVLQEQIRSHFTSDVLDTKPACMCRNHDGLSGGFNLGRVCKKCGTVVESTVTKPLYSEVWVRAPSPTTAFVSPTFWRLFDDKFSTGKFSLIEYLVDPRYQPNDGLPLKDKDPALLMMQVLENNNIERGLDYFHRNFDRIMNIVITPFPFLNGKTSLTKWERFNICEEFRTYIKRYRHTIFSEYLPVPNKILFPSEQTGATTYIDPVMSSMFDAIKLLCSIENPARNMSEAGRISKAARVNKHFVTYHLDFKSNKCMGGKKGIIRKQQGSTRIPFSARNVITPEAGVHEYDALRIPWQMGTVLLKLHVINKLLWDYNFTPKNAFRLMDAKVKNSSGPGGDLIDSIFKILIAECPENGIPVSFLRNPTLKKLSNQLFRIVEIIRDVHATAICISVLCIRQQNADFDGDEMQLRLLIDNKEKELFSRLAPHTGIISTNSPRSISSAITLHPELIMIVNNYFDHNRISK